MFFNSPLVFSSYCLFPNAAVAGAFAPCCIKLYYKRFSIKSLFSSEQKFNLLSGKRDFIR